MASSGIIQLGGYIVSRNRVNPNRGRIYSVKGIAPAMNCMEGGQREPCIVMKVSPDESRYI